ncbi:hypothetical protein E4L98_19925 [Duganella callida]|uniref:Uncharacterized protein n=2 Tax=Duganella callida TaxID=2561932 RepID=A0A4Y9SD60_9BURK|nr:hypothetical protein E4L98_19925 [Duganella callida]
MTADFTKGIDGWTVGMADYGQGGEPSEAAYGYMTLPQQLYGELNGQFGSAAGFYLISRNNSDDLLTFVKRQLSGFVPGVKYKLSFKLKYATDAAADAGCAGVGGSRGDNVYMIAAASSDEPKVVKEDNDYRLNIDHGNQNQAGTQSVVLGTQGAPGLSCDGGKWAITSHKSDDTVTVTADKAGKLWVVLGTDSGFESTNALYLLSATIDATPQ